MSVNQPIVTSNSDIQAAKAFIQNPQNGLKFEDSKTVASAIIDEISFFGEQNGIESQEGSVNRDVLKYYIAGVYSNEIAQYYMDNGVEFNSEQEYIDSMLNTGKLIAFSLDVDSSKDISQEEIMSALSFAENFEENFDNSKIALRKYVTNPEKNPIDFTPKSTSGELTQDELEQLFNFLTIGQKEFIKYDEGIYESYLDDAINSDSFQKQIDSVDFTRYDIRSQACAKLREGEQNIEDIDYDAIVRLLDYNHARSLIYENELNKQN